jgi:hypothetical protein
MHYAIDIQTKDKEMTKSKRISVYAICLAGTAYLAYLLLRVASLGYTWNWIWNEDFASRLGSL